MGRSDGFYRGTIALNTSVPGRAKALVLTALDLWDHGVVLRGAMALDRAHPWQPAIGLATDDGTSFTPMGGGGGSTGWHQHFEPTLPDRARKLYLFVGPDGRQPNDRTLPDEPTGVTTLPDLPVAVQRVAATLDTAAQLSVAPQTPRLDERLVGATRVLPVSAQLEGVGRDLAIVSIQTYPAWFFLHLAGSGGLPGMGPDGGFTRRMHQGWTAEDDRGGRYAGTVKHGSSGFPWGIDGLFTSALDPAATSLALAFPNPFGDGVVRTTVALPPA